METIPAALWDFFEPIEDPRDEGRNKRHLLKDILIIAVVGFACGMKSFDAIADFARMQEPWFRKFLKLPHGIPSHDTFERVFEMLDAGLSTPFIGRFRRARTGALSESQIRRLNARRQELEELDRRRGTMLRTLEREESVSAAMLETIRTCMDRFELEDLFVPHRRPEPEPGGVASIRGRSGCSNLAIRARISATTF